MSVGEALAEARGAAGLSVDEVSERTAIREIVIRSIERDDFDSLGGDLYVRGYLRKIAGAVGIDARPLIREFDAARSNRSGGWSALAGQTATAAAGPVVGPAAAQAAGDSPVDEGSRAGSEQAATETGPGSEAGLESAALESAALESAGLDSAGLDSAGLDSAGLDSAGLDSAGPDSAGPDSAGPDSAGFDSETEPESAAPVASDGWSLTGSDAWGDAEPSRDDEPAGTQAPPAAAGVSFGEAGDDAAESYWAGHDPAGSPSSEQSLAVPGWADQGWTEPVAEQAVWADAAPAGSADAPVSAAEPAGAPAARSARRPRRPGRPRPRTRVRGWRWVTTISAFTVVVLAIVAVASAEIVSRLDSTKSASAAAVSSSVPTATPSATTPQPTPSPVSSTPAGKPTPTLTARPPVPVRRLPVKADGAFGPDGLADGDNPQSASFAIASDPSAPWQTNWYTTADFGLLKHGTGLLLDMGKPVSVTSVRINLGDDWGADVQLRVGEAADLSQLPVLATGTNVGGQLTLRLKKPARARYILVWFVRLPPSGSGRYTASIYNVTVQGRP